MFDDDDSDDDLSQISGPPLFKTTQKPSHDQRDRGKLRKPQLFDDDEDDDDDNGNDNGVMKPPILPAVAPKLPPAPVQTLPPPPVSKPGLPPPNAAVSHQKKHQINDFDDDDDEDDDDDIGSSDEDDEDDDFDDPKATKAALKEALEENELLKKQLSQKSQLLIKVTIAFIHTVC